MVCLFLYFFLTFHEQALIFIEMNLYGSFYLTFMKRELIVKRRFNKTVALAPITRRFVICSNYMFTVFIDVNFTASLMNVWYDF